MNHYTHAPTNRAVYRARRWTPTTLPTRNVVAGEVSQPNHTRETNRPFEPIVVAPHEGPTLVPLRGSIARSAGDGDRISQRQSVHTTCSRHFYLDYLQHLSAHPLLTCGALEPLESIAPPNVPRVCTYNITQFPTSAPPLDALHS